MYEAQANLPAAGVNEDTDHAYNLMQAIPPKEAELAEARKEHGLLFPILLRDDVDISALAGSTDAELMDIVGDQVVQVLTDIDSTEDNLRDDTLRIWDLRDPRTGFDIIQITEQDLGIEEPLLLEVIEEWQSREKSEEEARNLFFSVLAITATILATLAAGPLGGALVGAVFGSRTTLLGREALLRAGRGKRHLH